MPTTTAPMGTAHADALQDLAAILAPSPACFPDDAGLREDGSLALAFGEAVLALRHDGFWTAEGPEFGSRALKALAADLGKVQRTLEGALATGDGKLQRLRLALAGAARDGRCKYRLENAVDGAALAFPGARVRIGRGGRWNVEFDAVDPAAIRPGAAVLAAHPDPAAPNDPAGYRVAERPGTVAFLGEGEPVVAFWDGRTFAVPAGRISAVLKGAPAEMTIHRDGAYFHRDTPLALVAALANLRYTGTRVRLFYGAQSGPDAGLDLNQDFAATGAVAVSPGPIPVPALRASAKARNGREIQTGKLVRVETASDGTVLWTHDRYRCRTHFLRAGGADGSVEAWRVEESGSLTKVASFEDGGKAQRYLQKMRVPVVADPGSA